MPGYRAVAGLPVISQEHRLRSVYHQGLLGINTFRTLPTQSKKCGFADNYQQSWFMHS
jgi:hypothetical protein